MCDLEKFKEKVEKCYFLTQDEIRQYYIDAGDNPDNNSPYVKISVLEKIAEKHPTLSQNIGVKVLEKIYESDNKIELVNSSDYLKSFLCKFLYKIDLDKKQLICYRKEEQNKFLEISSFNLQKN